MKGNTITRRFTILLSVFLLSLLAIVVLLLLGGKSPAPADSSAAPVASYTIGVWEERLAVFVPGREEPERLYDVYVSTLPSEEQDRLEKGIPVYSDAELARLLEDYTS